MSWSTSNVIMTTVDCGPFILSSDFDSGNFLKVEYVQPAQTSSPVPSTSQYSQSNFRSFDHEINLWTKPDCYGTRFENGNRTWFYFSVRSIKGGKHGVVKFNVLNLNKQVKLFQQGMQPVYRVLPDKPDWERVQDRLLINETGEHVCSISFKHRLPDNPNASILYIAFTYPFSYQESCDLLDKLDQRFLIPYAAQRVNPMSDLSLSSKQPECELYYHRECVCYSYEGRRVDLITVTSINGISNEREDRLTNLFPIQTEDRPFKFPGKQVVFTSSRVHPGETPSTFVLNGFLRFLLDLHDPRAILLRRLFVFKFIPILNPDGVARGHYRTDARGVNLNRVYLNPSPVLHPPIYAARKLLLYYHLGYDCPDDYEYPVDVEPASESGDINMEEVKSGENLQSCSSSAQLCEGNSASVDSASVCSNISCQDRGEGDFLKKGSKKPYTFVLSESNSLCAGCGPFVDTDNGDTVMSVEDLHPVPNQSPLNDSVLSHQCAFEACDEDSVFYENLTLKKTSSDISNEKESTGSTSSSKKGGSRASSARRRKKGSSKKEKKKRTTKSAPSSSSKAKPQDTASASFFDVLQQPSKSRYVLRSKAAANASLVNPINYKISSPAPGPQSGLFLYLDLHGHTTKRGIFMYGNHFSEAVTQAECMLLPRLMALNNPHFDFSACNFTERLMCMKDKRDGASREGSGRVACHKLTGLIRSYTLECNYNTGRIVNHVVTRPPSFGFLDSPTSATFQPPKFTIPIFEGIGKAIGESLLDLTGHNPWSRLGSTEFRTLDGVRRSLVKRLKLSPEYKTSGTELALKKSSVAGFEPNALFSPPKLLKKPKSKISLQPTLGGPLGLKRENQNLPADAKASGSQFKKLTIPPTVDCPTPGCSTAKEETPTTPPKISLKKAMKKKSLTKVPSKGKLKKLKAKKKKSDQSVDKLSSKSSSGNMN